MGFEKLHSHKFDAATFVHYSSSRKLDFEKYNAKLSAMKSVCIPLCLDCSSDFCVVSVIMHYSSSRKPNFREVKHSEAKKFKFTPLNLISADKVLSMISSSVISKKRCCFGGVICGCGTPDTEVTWNTHKLRILFQVISVSWQKTSKLYISYFTITSHIYSCTRYLQSFTGLQNNYIEIKYFETGRIHMKLDN